MRKKIIPGGKSAPRVSDEYPNDFSQKCEKGRETPLRCSHNSLSLERMRQQKYRRNIRNLAG